GEIGNKGFARLISHLKRLQLSSDERKCVLREAISIDHGLYMALEETLKRDNISGYIVDISKPSYKEPEIEVTEGLALNFKLLGHVFKLPITTIKSIPNGCRLAFSQALKIVLYKVVARPNSLDAWVRLFLFPRCTLQGPLARVEESTTGNTNIRQCLRKVSDGHFTAAVKFGVRVSRGVEAVLHSANRVLSEYHNDGSLAMLTVDFSNAFNLVDRSALLHKVRVKCPSISLWADFFYRHAMSCKLLLHAWYLNDGTIIGDSEEVSKVLDIIKASGLEAVFGCETSWGAVIRDTDFISGLALRRAVNAVDLMSLLPQLHDPQTSRAQSWVLQDHILRDSGICGMDDDYVSALAYLCDTIQSFNFSVFTNKDTAPSKSQQTLCLRAPHAQDFLLAIPIDGIGQHMSPVEYSTILKYRLMIPIFLVDEIFPICRKACLDSFREYAVHCKELPGFKYQHDMVRDVLFDVCRCAGIFDKKEPPVNFLTDPSDERSTLKPIDVLVFRWIEGKHVCVDLIGVSPLVRLSIQGFTIGHAALKATSCKLTKHEKACIENQHVFIPFAFVMCLESFKFILC
ncbi:hypothetical protein Tco_0465826, partial [Tanacetum coccineum]